MAGLVGIALRGFGKALGKIGKKKNLSLTEKLGMQDKGIISKKTGRLHPSHESAFGALSKRQVRKMTRTGQNPKLSPAKPNKFVSQRQIDTNKETAKKEAKYIRSRRFK
tara:strand:+ start:46 stop:372 length:327 start_codon:yes stop_codon:yes gene_type:complete